MYGFNNEADAKKLLEIARSGKYNGANTQFSNWEDVGSVVYFATPKETIEAAEYDENGNLKMGIGTCYLMKEEKDSYNPTGTGKLEFCYLTNGEKVEIEVRNPYLKSFETGEENQPKIIKIVKDRWGTLTICDEIESVTLLHDTFNSKNNEEFENQNKKYYVDEGIIDKTSVGLNGFATNNPLQFDYGKPCFITKVKNVDTDVDLKFKEKYTVVSTDIRHYQNISSSSLYPLEIGDCIEGFFGVEVVQCNIENEDVEPFNGSAPTYPLVMNFSENVKAHDGVGNGRYGLDIENKEMTQNMKITPYVYKDGVWSYEPIFEERVEYVGAGTRGYGLVSFNGYEYNVNLHLNEYGVEYRAFQPDIYKRDIITVRFNFSITNSFGGLYPGSLVSCPMDWNPGTIIAMNPNRSSYRGWEQLSINDLGVTPKGNSYNDGKNILPVVGVPSGRNIPILCPRSYTGIDDAAGEIKIDDNYWDLIARIVENNVVYWKKVKSPDMP